MKCEICDSSMVSIKENFHVIFGISELVGCQRCGHQSFYPREERKKDDDIFSSEYSKIGQHKDGISKSLISNIIKKIFYLTCFLISIQPNIK